MHCGTVTERCGKSDRSKWESFRWNGKTADSIQSICGHEESAEKTGRPLSKPKYYLMTDSGAVLWRKGEKNPGRGVKKNLKPYVYKHTKHVKVRCGTFCRMVRRVIVWSKVKGLRSGAGGKPSVKSTKVLCNRPETGWPIHGQVEVAVKGNGGPNRPPLKSWRMTCG